MSKNMKDFAADAFPDPERRKTRVFIPGRYDSADDVATVVKEADTSGWDEKDAAISAYNSSITTLDPDYAAFKPNRFMIVRCFHKRYMRSQGGIITSQPTMMVPEKTMNGIANLQSVPTPWAFMNFGVVVAVPEICKYKPGQLVQLDPIVVMPSDKQKLADWVLPSSFMLFTHQDWHSAPTSLEDKHFGYFFVSEHNQVIGEIPLSLFEKLQETV